MAVLGGTLQTTAKEEESSIHFSEAVLILPIIAAFTLCAVGILIVYMVVKAAVRNGTIEAYIRLRREKHYPAE